MIAKCRPHWRSAARMSGFLLSWFVGIALSLNWPASAALTSSPKYPWQMPSRIYGPIFYLLSTDTLFPGYRTSGGEWFSSPNEIIDQIHGAVGGTIASKYYYPQTDRHWRVLITNLPAYPGFISFNIDFDNSLPYGITCDNGSYAPPGGTPQCECTEPEKCLGSPDPLCPNEKPRPDAAPQPTAGDPITIGTGNLFETEVDFETAGPHPLRFVRYYNSMAGEQTARALGLRWRHNFERSVQLSGTGQSALLASIERMDGRKLRFYKGAAGLWSSDRDVLIALAAVGSRWAITNADDSVETYEGTKNGTFRLSSIEERGGYTQTLSYNSDGLLNHMDDSFGRTLTFSYLDGILHSLTAPGGLVVTYTYDNAGLGLGPAGRLISVRYSTSPETERHYLYEDVNFPYLLTGIVDENGIRVARWTYDAQGRATSHERAGGLDRTAIGYNSDGTRNVTNALGQVVTYSFASVEGVPKVTGMVRLDPREQSQARRAFSYGTNGFLASATDWNGNLTTYVNDARGMPTLVREAVGTQAERTSTYEHHPRFHLPVRISRPGERLEFTYDDRGNLIQSVATDATTGKSRSWKFEHDEFGRLLSTTGPRTDVSAVTRYGYDSAGFLKAITNAAGLVSVFTNDGRGLPLAILDPNGILTTAEYDARGRLLSSTIHGPSGDAVTRFGYDLAGNPTLVTFADGAFIGYVYDEAYRVSAVTNCLGERMAYVRDPAGNVLDETIIDQNGNIVRSALREFDSLGRLVATIGASGQTNRFSYDANGNRVAMEDGLSNKTRSEFDPLNQITAGIDPLGNRTAFGYDPLGRLTSVIDPRQLATTYTRDGFGRVIRQASPDSGITEYTPDEAGNRVAETDARGIAVSRTFDKLDRVTSEHYAASPGEDVTYTYDSQAAGDFGAARVTGISDETGSTSFAYDERGNLVSDKRTVEGHAYVTRYAYDIADRLIQMEYPSGHQVRYGRDPIGRIASVQFRTKENAPWSALATNITYLPFGGVTGLRYGNGLIRSNAYDLDFRLTHILTATETTRVQDLALSFDPSDNIRGIDDRISPSLSQLFTYDAYLRLVAAKGFYGELQYEYDGVGNRRTAQRGQTSERYEYPADSNRLLAVVSGTGRRAFTYTASGNMSGDDRGDGQAREFRYGARNRYRELLRNSNTIARYRYNALGQRLVKSTADGTTHFHYDQSYHLIAESRADGTQIREYVWLEDMPLAQIEGDGTVFFLHPDHLGTPRRMTDGARAVVWSGDTLPFGEAEAPTLGAGLGDDHRLRLQYQDRAGEPTVLQASADLGAGHWVAVATNVGAFTFTETSAADAKRFYRVVAVAAPAAAAEGVTCKLRFPGQYFDAESRLSHNRMRDYDSKSGRYAESDPLGLEGGITLYGYVEGNPIAEFDPDGQSGIKLIRWIIHGGRRIGKVPTGTIAFKSAVRARRIGKDCQIYGKNSEEARRLAKELEQTAHPNGDLIDHPKDAHIGAGNGAHVQTRGVPGHTFYTVASAFTATTYLGNGALGEAIDFFNPLSIPKDLADIYDDFSEPEPYTRDSCSCQ